MSMRRLKKTMSAISAGADTNGVPKRSAISLFSGAGGDTLGMKNAGYDVVAFSEFDIKAIETHLKAFPDSELLINNDTKSNDIRDIPNSVFEKYRGEIDLIFAGFPCQSFSNAGKKKVDDPRGELVHEFIRVTKIIKPRWIIGENVPGLLSRNGRNPVTGQVQPVIQIIEKLFYSIGYRITYKVINTADIGVPQARKRLIIVGWKEESRHIEFPWDRIRDSDGNHPCKSIRSILEYHLDGATEFNMCNIPEGTSSSFWIKTPYHIATGTPHKNLVNLVKGIRNQSSQEKLSSSSNGQLIIENGLISFGVRKSSYHGQILNPDEPCKTIICSYAHCPRLFVGLYNEQHNKYFVRCLSVDELGQIQGFPKHFPWSGRDADRMKQIGNAVPPKLVEYVVRTLDMVL